MYNINNIVYEVQKENDESYIILIIIAIGRFVKNIIILIKLLHRNLAPITFITKIMTICLIITFVIRLTVIILIIFNQPIPVIIYTAITLLHNTIHI